MPGTQSAPKGATASRNSRGACGDGQEARGPLRGIKIPCERVPDRAPPVTSAAWLGEAGVGQCPALRASHRLVPARVSAALGWGGGARLVPLGGWSGALGGNSCCISRDPRGQVLG